MGRARPGWKMRLRGIAAVPGSSPGSPGLYVAALFPDGLLHNPQGFIKTFEKFLQIVREEDHRLTVEAAGFLVFALHNIEVEIPQPVFFDIKKVRSVLQNHFCRKNFAPYSHCVLLSLVRRHNHAPLPFD
jgi:hypothetical protein